MGETRGLFEDQDETATQKWGGCKRIKRVNEMELGFLNA
jgi:hypothetical protein